VSGWGPIVLPKSASGAAAGQTQIPGDTSAVDPIFSVFNEITSVPSLTLSDILTFVIPSTPMLHLLYIEFGGTNMSEYWLNINSVTEAKGITYFGGPITGVWDFRRPGGGGKLLPAGKILKIQTEHCRPDIGDFFARLCYMEIN